MRNFWLVASVLLAASSCGPSSPKPVTTLKESTIRESPGIIVELVEKNLHIREVKVAAWMALETCRDTRAATSKPIERTHKSTEQCSVEQRR